MSDYPNFAKSERKDALVPDPQEFDCSDPDRSDGADEEDAPPLTARNRLDLFDQFVKDETEETETSS